MNLLSSTYSYRTFLISVFFIIFWVIILGYSIFFSQRKQNASYETIWVIDTSLSMSVEDISGGFSNTLKSRLDLAKSIISSGISSIPGDHAIIGYARTASVLVPLSQKNIYTENIISNIQPTVLYGWSSIEDALRLVNSLYTDKNQAFHIILLTDGGDSNMGEFPIIPSYAQLTIVAIGTHEWWKIPLGYNNEWERRYKRYQESEVIAPLETKNIETIGKKYNTVPVFIESWKDQENIISFLRWNNEYAWNTWDILIKNILSSFLSIFWSFLIIIGYLITPYKKPEKTKLL